MSSIDLGRHSPAPRPNRPENLKGNLSHSTDHFVHSIMDVFFSTNVAKRMIGGKESVLLFRSARDFAISRLHDVPKDQIKSGLKTHGLFSALLKDPEVQKFIRDENAAKEGRESMNQQATTQAKAREAVERKPIRRMPQATLEER